MGRMIHTALESAVQVGEGLGAAAETHTLAKVISTLFAVIAMIAHDASFDSDTLAWDEIFNPWTDSGYYAPCLMTEY